MFLIFYDLYFNRHDSPILRCYIMFDLKLVSGCFFFLKVECISLLVHHRLRIDDKSI